MRNGLTIRPTVGINASKEGKEINTYKPSGKSVDGDGDMGRRIGTAYQLEDGRIIYVPDEE